MLIMPERGDKRQRWIWIILVFALFWLLWRIIDGYSRTDCEQLETIGDSMVIGERDCSEP